MELQRLKGKINSIKVEPILISSRNIVRLNEAEKKKKRELSNIPIIKNKYQKTENLIKQINKKLHKHAIVVHPKKPKKEIKKTYIQQFFSETKSTKNKNLSFSSESSSNHDNNEDNKIFYDENAPYKRYIQKERDKKQKEEMKKYLENLKKIPKKEVKIGSCYDFRTQSNRRPLFQKYFDPEAINEANFLKTLKMSKHEQINFKVEQIGNYQKLIKDLFNNEPKKLPFKNYQLSDELYDKKIHSDLPIRKKIISDFKLRLKESEFVAL